LKPREFQKEVMIWGGDKKLNAVNYAILKMIRVGVILTKLHNLEGENV
jgi:hypothetical protein